MQAMTYSVDLREKIVLFVASGGKRAEATRIFGVSRKTVYNWVYAPTLVPKIPSLRHRKIDKQALLEYIRKNPDAMLKEISEMFGVSDTAIRKSLRKHGIRRKKNVWVYSKVCP